MDKNLRKLMKKYPGLTVERGGKHLRIRHVCKRGFITVSSSSSDNNYLFNVKRDLDKFINRENFYKG